MPRFRTQQSKEQVQHSGLPHPKAADDSGGLPCGYIHIRLVQNQLSPRIAKGYAPHPDPLLQRDMLQAQRLPLGFRPLQPVIPLQIIPDRRPRI